MLTISNDQIAALDRDQMRGFEHRMALHLHTHFPGKFGAAPEPETDAFVRSGIRRAREHGFHSERDICKYLSVMAECGADFDRGGGSEWASSILRARNYPPGRRAQMLVEAATERSRRQGRG